MSVDTSAAVGVPGSSAGAGSAQLRVAAWPGSPNPYQRLLHGRLGEQGVTAVVLPELTRSHTVNVLLLPLQLAAARAAGVRIWHLHWVYDFVPPWMSRRPGTLRLAWLWYGLVLAWCRVLGLRLIWTAHNVLPHERVFADDVAARKTLLRNASGLVVHDEHTLAELRALGLRPPARTVVAPHGPYEDWQVAPVTREQARAELGWPQARPVVLFFGRVNQQKGADLVAEAFAAEFPAAAQSGATQPGAPQPGTAAGPEAPLLVIAGRCTDDVLARKLTRLAEQSGGTIAVDLRLLDDAELQRLVVAADVVAAPFRSVTTSGSVLFALSLGVPVIVPDLPLFADLDPACCHRYRDGEAGLRAALRVAVGAAPGPGLTRRCREAAGAHSWQGAAERTAELYRQVLQPGRGVR